MKAIRDMQRTIAEKQRMGTLPTSAQLNQAAEQMRRHSLLITTAISRYEAALGSLQPDQINAVQTAVDQLTRTLGNQTGPIPAPADNAWVQTLSQRLGRTAPIPVAEEIPATLELVANDQVDAEALTAFESEFVSGDEQTRQAIDEGASWIASTRNVSLEVARLTLITVIFIHLSVALGVLLMVTPELTSWILAVSGVSVVDLTKNISKFAEGDRDQ